MQASTFVRRTDAGSAELDAPALGLSLTQRRILTLLDTECRLDELALRHPGPVDKLERDLARLTMLGLVVCETPYAANDAVEAVQPANEAMAAPSTVRLGSRRLRPFAIAVSFAIIATIAWLGWQRWASPRAPTGQDAGSTASASATAAEALGLGIEHGAVRARLTIDAMGNVGDVEIVESSHRAFNRALREALARWRFAPGAAGRTTMVGMAFKRD